MDEVRGGCCEKRMERTESRERIPFALVRPEDKPTAPRSSTVIEDKKSLFNTDKEAVNIHTATLQQDNNGLAMNGKKGLKKV